LGQIGDARAVEPLSAALKDGDNGVRKNAAWALGNLADARAVEPLSVALKDTEHNVRAAAAYALGQIGDARAVEPLSAALKDGDNGVRCDAAWALGKLADARAVEPLSAALKDTDPDVRRAAARVLGKLGGARAVEPLSVALKDSDSYVRSLAAQALGELADARAVEPLGAALKDTTDFAGAAAAEALGKLKDSRAVEPLIASLNDRGRVCDAAAKALIKIGDPRALVLLDRSSADVAKEPLAAALKEALQHPRSLPARGVAEAFKAIDCHLDPSLQARLLVAQGDWDGAVAMAEVAVEPLMDVLSRSRYSSDEEPDKLAAISALGRIGDARAVRELEISLDSDRDWRIRAAAAQALGQIRDARAVDALISRGLREDQSRDVRTQVATVLGEIGDQRAVKPLFTVVSEDWGYVYDFFAPPDPFYSASYAALGKLWDLQMAEPTRSADWDSVITHVSSLVETAFSLDWLNQETKRRKEARTLLIRFGALAVKPICQKLVSRDPTFRSATAPRATSGGGHSTEFISGSYWKDQHLGGVLGEMMLTLEIIADKHGVGQLTALANSEEESEEIRRVAQTILRQIQKRT
jgi:HEAT repeat protein